MASPTSDSVRSLFALEPAPDLAAFLAHLPAHSPAEQIGTWVPACEAFVESHWSKAVTGGLFSCWANIVPAITGTIPIGKDGAGDRFFAEVHPERSTVFMMAAGVGILERLASSLTDFVEMNHIAHDVCVYLDDHEIDPDELGETEIAASPILTARAAQVAALEGRIEIRENDSYGELLFPLSRKPYRLKSQNPVLSLTERAAWIQSVVVHNGDLVRAKATRPARAPEDLAALAPARVQALVEACVFAPDELNGLVEAAKTDAAEVVRMSGRALATLKGWKHAPRTTRPH